MFPIDPNGNLTQKTEGSDSWVYTWNAENQLTKVEKNGVEQARFAYDPIGRRVEKVAGGVRTSYAYDREDVLREVRDAAIRKYVHGFDVDEPVAVDDGVGVSYFHADGLGSVMSITNASGTAARVRQYDAWGSLEFGASQPGYAYTAREWDPETTLYYYRARYYDPKTGRFISEDPIGTRGGINFYAYVEGRPTLLRDPFGLRGRGHYVRNPHCREWTGKRKTCPAKKYDWVQCYSKCAGDMNPEWSDTAATAAGVAVSVGVKACGIPHVAAIGTGWAGGTRAGCAMMCTMDSDFADPAIPLCAPQTMVIDPNPVPCKVWVWVEE